MAIYLKNGNPWHWKQWWSARKDGKAMFIRVGKENKIYLDK